MFENIWRGFQIDTYFVINHSIQAALLLILILTLILLNISLRIRLRQKQSLTELLEQQHQLENVKYRLTRLSRICIESRMKQRLISNQLLEVDDAIFELEDRVTTLKEKFPIPEHM